MINFDLESIFNSAHPNKKTNFSKHQTWIKFLGVWRVLGEFGEFGFVAVGISSSCLWFTLNCFLLAFHSPLANYLSSKPGEISFYTHIGSQAPTQTDTDTDTPRFFLYEGTWNYQIQYFHNPPKQNGLCQCRSTSWPADSKHLQKRRLHNPPNQQPHSLRKNNNNRAWRYNGIIWYPKFSDDGFDGKLFPDVLIHREPLSRLLLPRGVRYIV